MKLAKRCPICDGAPRFVYYNIQGATEDPDGIFILGKRIECEDCGATIPGTFITCEEALEYWNTRDCIFFERYGIESILCEPKKEEPADEACNNE